MLFLRNLTPGAPWSPRFYSLDETSGIWESQAAHSSGNPVSGYASTLLTLSNDGWTKKLYAIYLRNKRWMIFDGDQEIPLDEAIIDRRPTKIGQASMTLESSVGRKSIAYLRPWIRHWFEGGWSLDDIDIANLISQSSKDTNVLTRLQRALNLANSDV